MLPDDTTVEVPLTQGFVALIDVEDAADILRFKWHIAHRNGKFYAQRTLTPVRDGRRGSEYLHRRLVQPPLQLGVDHINGNGLDCRRSNLRHANQQNNLRNQLVSSRNTSGFKGVSWDTNRRKWRAYIVIDRRQIYLGRFSCPKEAAHAYDDAARKLFGDFARANFNLDQER